MSDPKQGELPQKALAQVLLGAGVLASLVRFAGDVDLLAAGGLPVVAYFAWTLASGTAGTWLCWKDGRFDRTPALGGIPVEVRVSPAAAGLTMNGSAGTAELQAVQR